MNQAIKMGKMRRGWELTKSSWRVLMLDKELTVLPLLSIALSMVVILSLFAMYAFTGFYATNPGSVYASFDVGYWAYPILAFAIYILTLIGYFFTGAVICGATERFNGNDPTVKSCVRAASGKLKPLAQYSLLMATVGVLLQIIAERLPFGGKIAVLFFDAGWNIANFFALPVIMLSKENIKPIDATRQSVNIIKKTWGEGIAVVFTTGVISLLVALAYLITGGLAMTVVQIAVSSVASTAALYITVMSIVFGFLGMMVIILAFSTIEGIIKAALYHYATTGQSPVTFNQDLLRAAMTPKKARKIFG